MILRYTASWQRNDNFKCVYCVYVRTFSLRVTSVYGTLSRACLPSLLVVICWMGSAMSVWNDEREIHVNGAAAVKRHKIVCLCVSEPRFTFQWCVCQSVLNQLLWCVAVCLLLNYSVLCVSAVTYMINSHVCCCESWICLIKWWWSKQAAGVKRFTVLH